MSQRDIPVVNLQPSTCNLQPSTANLQSAICNPLTCNP